jgi:hypothetical protein
MARLDHMLEIDERITKQRNLPPRRMRFFPENSENNRENIFLDSTIVKYQWVIGLLRENPSCDNS